MNMKKIKHILRSFASVLKTKNIVPVQHIVDENKLLNGHVALITGGSGGIGMSIARGFLESGCNVIIAGTDEKKLKNCINALDGLGG